MAKGGAVTLDWAVKDVFSGKMTFERNSDW